MADSQLLDPDLPAVLVVEDVARVLHLSRAHVRRLLASGQLPGRRRGRRWVFVVAREHVGAAREDLAIFGELELHRLDRLTDRVEAERIGAIERERRRGLGEAVTFDDQEARRMEDFLNLALEAGAAGQAEPEPPARRFLDLAGARREIALAIDRDEDIAKLAEVSIPGIVTRDPSSSDETSGRRRAVVQFSQTTDKSASD